MFEPLIPGELIRADKLSIPSLLAMLKRNVCLLSKAYADFSTIYFA